MKLLLLIPLLIASSSFSAHALARSDGRHGNSLALKYAHVYIGYSNQDRWGYDGHPLKWNYIAAGEPYCKTPVQAVLSTMDCIEQEDAQCAYDGYAKGFIKLHNAVDSSTAISGPSYWAGAFYLLDFKLDFDQVLRIGPNQISLRYKETLTVPDGVQMVQYEHALVTVNSDCKMTLWDQYGDNIEQDVITGLNAYSNRIGAQALDLD
jgi:hypothetical protein